MALKNPPRDHPRGQINSQINSQINGNGKIHVNGHGTPCAERRHPPSGGVGGVVSWAGKAQAEAGAGHAVLGLACPVPAGEVARPSTARHPVELQQAERSIAKRLGSNAVLGGSAGGVGGLSWTCWGAQLEASGVIPHRPQNNASAEPRKLPKAPRAGRAHARAQGGFWIPGRAQSPSPPPP